MSSAGASTSANRYLVWTMEKFLYRRLIKKYHPDVTTCPRKKRIFEELSKRINHAYEQGDYEQLRAIDRDGQDFLNPRHKEYFDRSQTSDAQQSLKSRRERSSSKSVCHPVHVAFPFWRVRDAIRTLFYHVLNPYGLACAMNTWSENGRSWNILSIAGSIVWLKVFLILWYELIGLSTWSEVHGSPHESLGGLGITVAKGILLLACIPIMIPLASLAFFVGMIFWFCLIVCAVGMPLLGAFHPYLAWIPPLLCLGVIIRAIWEILEEDL